MKMETFISFRNFHKIMKVKQYVSKRGLQAFLSLLVLVFMFGSVSAIDTSRQMRLDFGHVMTIESISFSPMDLTPGSSGNVLIKILNDGNLKLYDIRAKLIFPSGIFPLNDVDEVKISKLAAGEEADLVYKVIVSPSMAEGVYEASLSMDYLNSIGDERQDNNTFGVIVKSVPKIFAVVDSTTLYKGNSLGDVTVKFINNDIADVKFLTVKLQNSKDYQIISSAEQYLGDLDSDDFESADFKIKLNNKMDSINIPLSITYKDSLNTDYSQDINLELVILSASESGVSKSNTTTYVLVIVILVIAYVVYRRYKKGKKNSSKK